MRLLDLGLYERMARPPGRGPRRRRAEVEASTGQLAELADAPRRAGRGRRRVAALARLVERVDEARPRLDELATRAAQAAADEAAAGSRLLDRLGVPDACAGAGRPGWQRPTEGAPAAQDDEAARGASAAERRPADCRPGGRRRAPDLLARRAEQATLADGRGRGRRADPVLARHRPPRRRPTRPTPRPSVERVDGPGRDRAPRAPTSSPARLPRLRPGGRRRCPHQRRRRTSRPPRRRSPTPPGACGTAHDAAARAPSGELAR